MRHGKVVLCVCGPPQASGAVPGWGLLSQQADISSLEGVRGMDVQLQVASWAGVAWGQQTGEGSRPHEGEAVDGEKERGPGKGSTCIHIIFANISAKV